MTFYVQGKSGYSKKGCKIQPTTIDISWLTSDVLFCFVFCFVLFCIVLFCFILLVFFVLFLFCFVLFCVLFCFVCFVLFFEDGIYILSIHTVISCIQAFYQKVWIRFGFAGNPQLRLIFWTQERSECFCQILALCQHVLNSHCSRSLFVICSSDIVHSNMLLEHIWLRILLQITMLPEQLLLE